MIPKTIHWCWFSDEIPADVQNFVDGWKRLMPDYEIIRWNAGNFDVESVKWVKQAVENKKWAFAADYIRLWAVHNYGGIYLDSDVEVLKPFDDLLALPYFIGEVPFGSNKDIPEPAIFGAEKDCCWVKNCLNYYKERNFVKKDNQLDLTPITAIFHYILKKKYTGENSIKIFTRDFFSAKKYMTNDILITKNTYSIHHGKASWLTEKPTSLPNELLPKIYLPKNIENRNIYIWGTGILGNIALKQCQERGLKIKSFLDTKAENGEYIFKDYECIAPSKILLKTKHDFFIIVANRYSCDEIYKNCRDAGLEENQDFWIPIPKELIDNSNTDDKI